MANYTVIPQDTFDSLQVDVGVLLKTFNPATPAAPSDADIICPTTGGITVNCTPSYSDWGEDVDNCPVNMKELKHLDGWDCKISFTSLAAKADAIKLALGAADVSGNKITPRRNLTQADFADLWWVGDRADGGLVACKIMNALSTGGFSLQTTKNGKGTITCELTGHVSLSAQDTVPMEFYTIAPSA